MKKKHVIVIGAGPAGMMAAIAAADEGASVTLLEKNDRVGRKLNITGKGRCNLTADVELDEMIKGFSGNGRFLYSSLAAFSNQDLIRYFAERGLETKTERGNRVFPVSDDAGEVVAVLRKHLSAAGVKIQYSTTVQAIRIKDGEISGVVADTGKLDADAVIVATGGMSYPLTGSTGDGYRFAKTLGHKIVEPRPGLVPLLAKEEWIAELQGLNLKNVKATAYTNAGKVINEDFGELLFTAFGISGPIILSMSQAIGAHMMRHHETVSVHIDLKPALSIEKLTARIQRDFDAYARKQFQNALGDLLPSKLIPVFVQLSGIDPEKECSQINRAERAGVVQLLKHFVVTVHGTRPIAEAIVTVGGVDVREIQPKTMESKRVKGLFFAGEVLDIDGYTGGYNLQAAFSTGYVAGKHAAAREEQ